MNNVRLAPEYHSFPTWVTKEGVRDNVHPADLPISPDLAAALLRWADRWDEIYDPQDPAAAGFADQTQETGFVADGEVLGARLVRELGLDWEVTYLVPGSRAEMRVSG